MTHDVRKMTLEFSQKGKGRDYYYVTKSPQELTAPIITRSSASVEDQETQDNYLNCSANGNLVDEQQPSSRKESTISKLERLRVDYVPSWKPNRRYSSPAVRHHRSFSPRRNKYMLKTPTEIQRNRASSLPNTEVKDARRNSDWKRSGSPNNVEQRFLQLPESSDYDKIRSFTLTNKGELVDHGYCYRRRSDTSSSESGTARSASPSELDSPSLNTVQETVELAQPKTYNIMIVGGYEVGKTSLINQFQNCELANVMGRGDSLEDETKRILSVLISGTEMELTFTEFDTTIQQQKPWDFSLYDAVLVLYTITSKRSFSTAADVLYRFDEQLEVYNRDDIPIFLVGNKIDLERQRVVQEHDAKELAKSYDCKFIEISVALGHQTDDLLKNLLLEIRRCEMEKMKPVHQKHRRKSSYKKIVKAHKPRANSLHNVPIFGSLRRRLARSCEDVIARLLR